MGKNRKSGEIRESKDLAEKEFESFPDVAADLINVLLYNGKRVVQKENLVSASTESFYRGKGRLRNQYQDLADYEMVDGKIHALYQFANQSGTDSRMALRTAGYSISERLTGSSTRGRPGDTFR